MLIFCCLKWWGSTTSCPVSASRTASGLETWSSHLPKFSSKDFGAAESARWSAEVSRFCRAIAISRSSFLFAYCHCGAMRSFGTAYCSGDVAIRRPQGTWATKKVAQLGEGMKGWNSWVLLKIFMRFHLSCSINFGNLWWHGEIWTAFSLKYIEILPWALRNLTFYQAADAIRWPSDWLQLWLGMTSTSTARFFQGSVSTRGFPRNPWKPKSQ